MLCPTTTPLPAVKLPLPALNSYLCHATPLKHDISVPSLSLWTEKSVCYPPVNTLINRPQPTWLCITLCSFLSAPLKFFLLINTHHLYCAPKYIIGIYLLAFCNTCLIFTENDHCIVVKTFEFIESFLASVCTNSVSSSLPITAVYICTLAPRLLPWSLIHSGYQVASNRLEITLQRVGNLKKQWPSMLSQRLSLWVKIQ